jgi:hypothetical protein
MFRRGIRPVPEDPENASGSCLGCHVHFDSDELDAHWKSICVAILDQASVLEHDCINGVKVRDSSSEMSSYDLEVWLSTNDETVRNRINDQVMRVLADDGVRMKHPVNFAWTHRATAHLGNDPLLAVNSM